MSIGPGGGLSIGPGGGLYLGPGGGLYVGACHNPYKSNWPPIERLLKELLNRGMTSQHALIARSFGFS